MCRNVFFWVTEYLNYFALIFFGIKLFLRKYDVQTGRKEWVENVIIIVVSAPVVWLAADNYRFSNYSTFITLIMMIYMFLIIKIMSLFKVNNLLFLVAIYVYGMRLIDLWIVAVISEANRISRHIFVDLINFGIERSLFICFLCLCYVFIYNFCRLNNVIEYLRKNIIHSIIISCYMILGNGCFSMVYRFNYQEKLIDYWIFYILCAFIIIGGVLFYFTIIKGKEKERLLCIRNNMTEANYIGLQKAYNMNKTLQHDYKNHLLAISELLKLNKCEEALNYINKYNDYGKNFFANVDSGFSIVDIVVNSKIAESTEKSINFRYEIENIGNIFIEDIDMCALLSNLLDNAIEGCEKVVDRNKEIYLNIFIRNKMLFINISNTINVDIFKKKQLFQTDKENEKLHGWGSYSIDCVVKKYEGTKEYNINKDRIEIIINLPI